MSYLLDIFNKRQPAPQVSAPQQWQRPMAMPSGGPNTGAPVPIPFLNEGVQGESAPQPAQFRHQYQASGIQPPSMMSQLNAQNSPPPGLAAMFSGGATPPPMGAGPSWASMTGNMSGGGMGGGAVDQMPANPSMGGMWSGPANPSIGGVGQMPAFQPPQPMPFNSRPMPQWGAPNFSMENGTIGAPQPSPMTGMMKGMFGVR